MYADDSFFTLTTGGRIGLVAVSALLVLAVFGAVRALFRLWRLLPIRMAVALAAFWVFLWLSPQVYYLYYQFIIDGLRWQIVIGAPPGPLALVELLTFTGRAAISAHAQGLLGWLLLAVAPVQAALR